MCVLTGVQITSCLTETLQLYSHLQGSEYSGLPQGINTLCVEMIQKQIPCFTDNIIHAHRVDIANVITGITNDAVALNNAVTKWVESLPYIDEFELYGATNIPNEDTAKLIFSNRKKIENISDNDKIKMFDELFNAVESHITDEEAILKESVDGEGIDEHYLVEAVMTTIQPDYYNWINGIR